ncbi:Protein kinase-like domain protein [Cordyceps fumosorosea ARSEF 2679]|uniref:Protein kinase-like domain protein n=1 Tax=Cordyceps fumosorosea (strain ARSEF 2679) TaxID=1081104 RepID=A0A168CED4_CORFA|nr:Protein kinase-like domain protein [Cordyceps fumosorosea ARSEF 2679]OAA71277.1 Protein kinase-like domain protein [Cordyceps fumosorosea ARSEF 2679]
MQLVDRGDAPASIGHSKHIAGRLYHTDSRIQPHISRQSLPKHNLQTLEGSQCVDLAYQGTEEIVLSNRTILKIGRDERANSFLIGQDAENYVSRKHCEVYVVLYELGISHVYVRDRKSCNGTYVNGLCIGDSWQVSSGHLLADGDVITIQPYWQFLFKQEALAPEEPLSTLQAQESQLFQEKYTILPRVLGAGSQGCVHLAVKTASRKQLVCKIINLKQAGVRGRQQSPQKMLQESEILRRLKHPNILTYVDALWSPHTLDLKPENILLACSPKVAYQRVMLSDFGSCALPLSNKLKTNVGTQNFQAPEVLRGEEQTAAADIWSLGVISMLLVSGCGLPGIDGLARLDQSSLGKTLDAVSADCEQASANAKDFILRCMKIKASDRITSTDAYCHDWFHTPTSHLEFFQRLDARTTAL